MSNAEIARLMIARLEALAAETAGAGASLVSVAMEKLRDGEVTRVEAKVERKTRTLLFLSAEAFTAAGARIATATSVHRVSAA